jgi:hypothetical protein
VIGIDKSPPLNQRPFDEFIQCDLDGPALPHRLEEADVVLLLDVIQRLKSPESFAATLHQAVASTRPVKVVVTTGNVGFIIPRLMLLLGQLNYGKRGILDRSHTRLFTFDSLRRLFEESGFAVQEVHGIPVPVPLVVRNQRLARLLLRANQLLINVSRSMFAYQVYMVLRPLPTIEQLLDESRTWTAERAGALAFD